MQLDPSISAALEHETRTSGRTPARTSAILFEDQIETIERKSGESRGNGKRKFARMLQIVVDAGIMAIESSEGNQSGKGKTPRPVAAKQTGRGVATAIAAQE